MSRRSNIEYLRAKLNVVGKHKDAEGVGHARERIRTKMQAASTEATCSGGCGHERARLNPYSPGFHWIEEYNRWYPRDNVPEKVARVGKHTHDLGNAHPLPVKQGGETAVYFVMPCGDLWAQDVDGIVDGAYDTETMDSEDKEALESDHATGDHQWKFVNLYRGYAIEVAPAVNILTNEDGLWRWRVFDGDAILREESEELDLSDSRPAAVMSATEWIDEAENARRRKN